MPVYEATTRCTASTVERSTRVTGKGRKHMRTVVMGTHYATIATHSGRGGRLLMEYYRYSICRLC